MQMTDDDKIILEYGLELICENFIKLLVICTIGALSGLFTETILMLSSFCILRFYAGGFHLKTNVGCTVSMLLFWGFTIICNEFIELQWVTVIIIYVIDVFILVFFSPRDGKESVISNPMYQKRNKVLSIIIISIFFLLCVLVWQRYKEVVAVSETLECLSIISIKGGRLNEK